MSSLAVVNVSNVNERTSSLSFQLSTCELCISLSSHNILIRPVCTFECKYCNKRVCAGCCASIAINSQLPFGSILQQHAPKKYKLARIKQYICLECIVQDRHQSIMKGLYKVIGDIMDINILSIIALFAIQECNECNKIYPKIVGQQYRPKRHLESIFETKSKFELKYCKICHVEHERDIIFNAIYNSSSITHLYSNHYDFKDIMNIIDIITLYSIGSILNCTNFDKCSNKIIVNNKFDGFIKCQDEEDNVITFSNTLDKIFCGECTINENRSNGIYEYCSYCKQVTKFGHNVTCHCCGDRFCDQCLNKNQDNDCYIEYKYYFDDTCCRIKYYQYCNQCSYDIIDDIDLLDDDISSISYDPYQQLINDVDYTQYQSIDPQFYYISSDEL